MTAERTEFITGHNMIFPITPLDSIAIKAKKIMYGKFINDADYKVTQVVNGCEIKCPYYQCWTSMITRSNNRKYKDRKQTYENCSVCEEWHIFSNFKRWMMRQDWKGKQLDKDLLIPGNKEYSPKTCLFVTSKINKLFANNAARRGRYPIGVHFSKSSEKYIAMCRTNSKTKYIGAYDSPEKAHRAYLEFKVKVVRNIALDQEQPLQSALLYRTYLLERGY